MMSADLNNEDLPKSFRIFLTLQEAVRREIASTDFSSQDEEEGDQALSSA
jgi:hypothetical protein